MTMLTLSKWGNAQAVRLPKAMREQVGMPDDSQIEATVENGAIVLKPARSAKRAIRVANLASVFKDRASPTGPAKMISVLQRGMRVCDMCHYGDVLMVDLDPSKGHEQRKRRPVVVVSNDAFNRNCTLTVVAAISHGRGDFELHIPFSPVPASDVSNGGSGVADGFVQLEQIRALDLCQERCEDRIAQAEGYGYGHIHAARVLHPA